MRDGIVTIRIGKGRADYREIDYPKLWKDRQPDKSCTLCNKEFKIGDKVLMVITNGAFPNTVIHQSCVDHDLILTTHAISKSYDEFAKYIREHKGWKQVMNNEM